MKNTKDNSKETSISEEDELFKILTHNIRRNIIKVLADHDLTFSEIQKQLEIDSPTLSYHLKHMNAFVIQKKTKYTFSEIGRAASFLLTKTDQSIKMSRSKRYFRNIYILTYICWVFIGILTPILLTNLDNTDLSIAILEITINIVAFLNIGFIGSLKSRYI